MRSILSFLGVLAIVCVVACRPPQDDTGDVSPADQSTEESTAGGDAETATQEADTKSTVAETWDFEKADAGSVPEGWSVAKTGEGPGGEWTVLADESAPAGPKVLGQVSSDGPKPLFCLCIADETSYGDVDLSVSLKGIKGSIDQGGGPMWRVQDENNYYVARMNPLEFNFRLYKVVDGKRTKLASADVEIPDDEGDIDEDDPLLNKWHTIRVVHRGDQIQCYLNGELSLEFEDASIPDAGKIGLWAKADAVTSFDNLSASAPSE